MYSHHYIIYGLRIASNQDVAGLSSQSFDGLPDVRLEILGAGTWTFTPIPDELLLDGVKRMEGQWHSLRVWQVEGILHVRYQLNGEQVDFAISVAGDRVQVIWSNDFPAADVPAFFLGPVIGCVLRLGCGGAARRGGGCRRSGNCHLGGQGRGESTLIGEFARQGYPILSDDVGPLFERGGRFWVHPGYPRLRLWPETLKWLSVDHQELPRVESIFGKRYLDLSTDENTTAWRFCEHPRPLVAAFVLGERRDGQPLTILSVSPPRREHPATQQLRKLYFG